MHPHGLRRSYSQRSLDCWLERLTQPWEQHFSVEELEEGRRIYRSGEVRALELSENEAVVRRRLERFDEYAVIDWGERGMHVRCSCGDAARGRALAVAGLHEVEELVADELAPLQGGQEETAAAAADPKPAPALGSRLAEGAPAAAAPSGLVLVFEVHADGLVFRPYWNGENKRIPVGSGPSADCPGRTLSEKAHLVALAALARRARFRYRTASRDYQLGDLAQVPDFVRRLLPEWRRRFTVEVPEGIERLAGPAQQVSVATRVSSAGEGMLDLRLIFESGGRLLTQEEVSLLRSRPGAPILVPDVGFITLTAEKTAALARWDESAKLTAAGTLPAWMLFSLFQPPGGKPEMSPELAAWCDAIRRNPSRRTLPDFLRPYQRRGVEWLAHLCDHGCHGLLADEMGLGKTLQVLTLLATRPLPDHPHIIVCPASVIPVWRAEAARHFPRLQLEILRGERTFADVHRPVVWLCSYAQLRRQRPLLDVVEFGYAVLDEAQFIKNPDAKVAQACYAIRARHRIALTGTPIENRPLDLWSNFHFLMPGLLGRRETFERYMAELGERAGQCLRTQIGPFLLRRTKRDVATELPAKTDMVLPCPLTDAQRVEYARICEEGLKRLGEDLRNALKERSFGVFALLTRLRQVCCDPSLLPWVADAPGQSGKINALCDILDDLFASGHKVVVFSQFVSLLRRVDVALQNAYPRVPRFSITGATSDRTRPVREFQAATGAAAMLLSLKAAGTGITLHAADYVFLLDPWWNPAVEEQAIDRVHRIGQTRNVFVYRLIAPGTIEERIQLLQAGKRELFREIVDGIPAGLELGEHFASLYHLIRLADEAE